MLCRLSWIATLLMFAAICPQQALMALWVWEVVTSKMRSLLAMGSFIAKGSIVVSVSGLSKVATLLQIAALWSQMVATAAYSAEFAALYEWRAPLILFAQRRWGVCNHRKCARPRFGPLGLFLRASAHCHSCFVACYRCSIRSSTKDWTSCVRSSIIVPR